RRRGEKPHQRSRAPPHYFRRWLHPGPARHSLSFVRFEINGGRRRLRTWGEGEWKRRPPCRPAIRHLPEDKELRRESARGCGEAPAWRRALRVSQRALRFFSPRAYWGQRPRRHPALRSQERRLRGSARDKRDRFGMIRIPAPFSSRV